MTTMPETLAANAPVNHPRHGAGYVIADTGEFVVARFGAEIQQVLRAELTLARSLDQALATGTFDESAETLMRASAMAIRSVNDQWGVFSRSRVQLLPHQLWVCHKVNRTFPFRWLVADDVGLGKTIEAGLVLMPLVARAQIRRLLVLAPAKLVPQWQKRLRQMFDIRLQVYDRSVDTPTVDFWDTANMVVASVHTLRREVADGRSEGSRFLSADPWDAVVVDEAHHLHADERTGETLSFQLLRALEERHKIRSLLLFTGTPHRGKDFGFLSLLSLLDPDQFGPEHDIDEQLTKLPDVMIRNNKATVTDLKGNRLFTPVTVETREYAFSPEESAFYETLSSFIIDGRAYASTLDGRAQSARMLLLIALQKLAASSIAAIRSALTKRRAKLADARAHVGKVGAAERDVGAAAVRPRRWRERGDGRRIVHVERLRRCKLLAVECDSRRVRADGEPRGQLRRLPRVVHGPRDVWRRRGGPESVFHRRRGGELPEELRHLRRVRGDAAAVFVTVAGADGAGEAAAAPFEQGGSELLFGLLELLAHRADGDAEFVSRGLERAKPADRFDRAQACEMDPVQVFHIEKLN